MNESASAPTPQPTRPGLTQRLLDWVERAGNKLPQPVTLFAAMIALVLVASLVFSLLGTSAEHPGTGETIRAVNLLNAEGIQRIFTQMVTVFTSFPPLGLVLAVMLGIGVAERSGLVAAGLKGFVAVVPRRLVTMALVTAGMLSSVAADAGYVVLIPLGAVIFRSMGRHPLAGLAAAFAGVSGGFGANLFLTGLDPLMAGFTQPAARMIDPAYTVDPTANWWLLAASVPVVAIAGTYVTERILEPRLGQWRPEEGEELPGEVDGGDGAGADTGDDDQTRDLNATERKALLWANLTGAAILVLIAAASIQPGGIFRAEDGSFDPLFAAIVPLMMVLFFIPGLVYGRITGSVKGDKDVAQMTAGSMADMGAYIVLAFVAAQFVAYFNWSNLGVIFAISGADLLQSIGFTGIPLIVTFILVSSFINLLIGSASAKWAIMAPIFVPMLMLMGYSPELTQAAYRIGDSYSNILTPLLPYFPLIIVFAQKYQKDLGIGTIISLMLPYAIVFAIARIVMLVIWMLIGLPIGPDAPLEYTP
ncbi:AbgT family transporter [bacterium]|nr:AbgT family transporter [bacterium]